MLPIDQIALAYPPQLQGFRRNMLREYLQYHILSVIFSSAYGSKLSFLGGTALRIVHGNTRFSEDLDFDNFDLSESDFEAVSHLVRDALQAEGYLVDIRTVTRGAYHCYIRIPQVLYQNGLSPLPDERIHLRLDTDPHHFSYPPDQIIINKFDIFARIHVTPVDILLSQKIYAVLNRKRAKGRDFYDIIFLLSRTRPHYAYLHEKISFTDPADLKQQLIRLSQTLDFDQLAQDVAPFLFDPSDRQKVTLFPDYLKQIDL